MRCPLLIGICVFGGCAQPDIRVTGAPISRQHFSDILRSLGKQQPVQLAALGNEFEKIAPPRRINLIVEDIGKRGTKHPLSSPEFRLEFWSSLVPSLRRVPVGSRGSPTRMVAPSHLTAPFRPLFRITEIASRRC